MSLKFYELSRDSTLLHCAFWGNGGGVLRFWLFRFWYRREPPSFIIFLPEIFMIGGR